MKTFGQRLKDLRELKGVNQEQLANVLGITRATISGYEIDRNEPSYQTLKQLANYFEVSIDYLLGNANQSSILDSECIRIAKKIKKSNYDIEDIELSIELIKKIRSK